MRRAEITYTLMPEFNTLGFSRGAGGIDQVGKVVSCHGNIGIVCALPRRKLINVQGFSGGVIPWMLLCRYDESRAGVINDVPDALCGILRVAGDKGRSGLHHAKYRREVKASARQKQYDAVPAVYAKSHQAPCDAVGAFIEFPEGKGPVTGDQRRTVFPFRRSPLKHAMEKRFRNPGLSAAGKCLQLCDLPLG